MRRLIICKSAPNPKTFSEALNLIVEDFTTNYDVFGGDVDELEISYMDSDDVDVYFSLIAMPGSIDKDRIALDFDDNNFYVSTFIETDDFAKAKAKYDEIGRLLKSVTIRNPQFKSPKKLAGSLTPANASLEKTVSTFSLGDGLKAYELFNIWLELIENEDGDYIVMLKIGEQED